jgi:hypothetical protein
MLLAWSSTWANYFPGDGQGDTNSVQPDYKKRLIGVSVTASALYAGTMTGLYYLWYADYPKSEFHFVNDAGQWLYMDKIGHVTTSYWVGRIGYESLRWSGVSNKKAIWYGGTWGLVYLTSVEVFDGFSEEWGASAGDIAANTIGTGIFIGQQFLFNHQPVVLKFSFHQTEYAQYRPDLLGENFIQSLLKDYNGQTYWLSANIASFLPKSSPFPKWLDISFGYSGEGMLGASSNPAAHNGEPLPDFERYSQYFLSMDVDLTKIKTNNETVRFLLNLIGYLKIPFPAVEFNRIDKVKWHWMYY